QQSTSAKDQRERNGGSSGQAGSRLVETLRPATDDGKAAGDVAQLTLTVRQSYISNYETGERRLDAVELILVCNAIGLDPAGVVEQVAEVVTQSPPKVIRSKRASPKVPGPGTKRKGPRKRKE
ncbi:MAG: helix-turn-helix transcriptional regulator, partial [Sumerlaeia bacterium]